MGSACHGATTVCVHRPAVCTLQEAGKGEQPPVHFDPFPTLPADFGPEVPDEGIDGLLLVSAGQKQY